MNRCRAYIQVWKHISRRNWKTTEEAAIALKQWLVPIVSSWNESLNVMDLTYCPNYAVPMSYSELADENAWLLWSSVEFSLVGTKLSEREVEDLQHRISVATQCPVHVSLQNATILKP
jgi:hypothetical protein